MEFNSNTRKTKSLESEAENEFDSSLRNIALSKHHCPANGTEEDLTIKRKSFFHSNDEDDPLKKPIKEQTESFGGEYGGKAGNSLKDVAVGCACCGWMMSAEDLIGTKKGKNSGEYSANGSLYSTENNNSSYGNKSSTSSSGNYGRK